MVHEAIDTMAQPSVLGAQPSRPRRRQQKRRTRPPGKNARKRRQRAQPPAATIEASVRKVLGWQDSRAGEREQAESEARYAIALNSACDYATNPHTNTEMPKAPYGRTARSVAYSARQRGFASTGTLGYGYVGVNPYRAYKLTHTPLLVSGSTNVLSGTTTPLVAGTGLTSVAFDTPNDTGIGPGYGKMRVVAAEIRIRNITQLVNRAGAAIAHSNLENVGNVTATPTFNKACQDWRNSLVSLADADAKWISSRWVPRREEDEDFYDNESNFPTGAANDAVFGIFFNSVVGTAQTVEYEAVVYFELVFSLYTPVMTNTHPSPYGSIIASWAANLTQSTSTVMKSQFLKEIATAATSPAMARVIGLISSIYGANRAAASSRRRAIEL